VHLSFGSLDCVPLLTICTQPYLCNDYKTEWMAGPLLICKEQVAITENYSGLYERCTQYLKVFHKMLAFWETVTETETGKMFCDHLTTGLYFKFLSITVSLSNMEKVSNETQWCILDYKLYETQTGITNGPFVSPPSPQLPPASTYSTHSLKEQPNPKALLRHLTSNPEIFILRLFCLSLEHKD
jgi:hypothetical protein